MTVTYTPAPDAASIAKGVIERHHPHLADVRIEFVFRDKHAKSNRRVVAGKAKKVSGLQAFMARPVTSDVEDETGDDFFLIELAADIWLGMGPATRRALIDHELCHCRTEFDKETGEIKLYLLGHDVEEFTEIVQRHGVWDDELKAFAEAVKEQLALDFDGDDEPGSIEEAAADLAGVVDGERVTSMTISSGGKSVTIDKDTADRIREAADR